MREGSYNLGGEQSGHIILRDHSTTGDGLIAALQVLAALIEHGGQASAVGRSFEPLPQHLKNARFAKGSNPLAMPLVKDAIGAAEARLKGVGRLLIRPSGTEPVIRVMAEGEDDAMVLDLVSELATLIENTAAA